MLLFRKSLPTIIVFLIPKSSLSFNFDFGRPKTPYAEDENLSVYSYQSRKPSSVQSTYPPAPAVRPQNIPTKVLSNSNSETGWKWEGFALSNSRTSNVKPTRLPPTVNRKNNVNNSGGASSFNFDFERPKTPPPANAFMKKAKGSKALSGYAARLAQRYSKHTPD